MSLERWQKIQLVFFCVIIALMVIAIILGPGMPRTIVTAVFMTISAVAVAGGLKYGRCPSCDRILPHRIGGKIEFCPFCGEPLY